MTNFTVALTTLFLAVTSINADNVRGVRAQSSWPRRSPWFSGRVIIMAVQKTSRHGHGHEVVLALVVPRTTMVENVLMSMNRRWWTSRPAFGNEPTAPLSQPGELGTWALPHHV
jgi:hypothetical protein